MFHNKKLNIITASLLTALSLPTYAAGLSLSQIGTTESVATAGVAGATNNRDASATITNPAGLSGIEDNSFMFGVQYIDVNTELDTNNNKGIKGTKGMPGLHLSYATRLNEQWVTGFSVHSTGGLGLEYPKGVIGGESIESNMIGFLNLTASAAYQLNSQLSLGASIIGQVAVLETSLYSENYDAELSGSNFTPTFNLAAMYQLSDNNSLGLVYRHQAKHDLDLELDTALVSTEVESKQYWPSMLELGFQHDLDEKLSLMLSANWQKWSTYGDKYDDTFGGGAAVSYQLDKWTLQTGMSFDSSPISAQKRDPLLPLDKQWRLGFGGSRTLNNGMVLGLAYQYQSLGKAKIDNVIQGSYNTNETHFITTSLSF